MARSRSTTQPDTALFSKKSLFHLSKRRGEKLFILYRENTQLDELIIEQCEARYGNINC